MSEKKLMKAAILEAFHTPLKIQQIPVPEPGAGQVLVKVMASGLCLTDTHIQDGVIRSVKVPYVPGHEMAGIVERLGADVKGLSVGTHVVCNIDMVCRHCALCEMGRENLCTKRVRVGFEANGSHEEYAVVPAENLIPISDDIPFAEAAIIPDAVACMYHAIKDQGKVKAGDRILLHGCAALGLQGVQIAKYLGATVYATSRTPAKLEKALEFGADAVINTREQELYSEIERLSDGKLCDVIFDLVGTSGSIDELLKCLRPGGKLVAVAYSAPTFTVDYQEVVIKEKEIIGIRGSTGENLREAVRLVEEKKIRPYVSKLYTLEEINDALQALRECKSLGRSAISFEQK